MQISSTDNSSFGQIYCVPKIRLAADKLLQKYYAQGKVGFATNFSRNWQKCQNTDFADLHILANGDVFVKGKTHGSTKKIDSFSEVLFNIDSGLKHVLLAEDQKLLV